MKNNIIVSIGVATGLFIMSPIHPAWDNWFWNLACMLVATFGVDALKGKRRN